LAFTGIRGVVSLAAALAIPLATAAGAPFPERDMILAVTFIVIVVTLVGQGLLLPTVIRWLGFAHNVAAERKAAVANELAARTGAIRAALAHIEELARERELPADLVGSLRDYYNARLRELKRSANAVEQARLAGTSTRPFATAASAMNRAAAWSAT
jgi:CPA1 family monovalent cation:H+ antiporter